MKKLFAVLSSIVCLTLASEASAYQPVGQYYDDQCVGQCVDPCVGQCEPTCGRFYIGAFGGANWLHIGKIDGIRLKSKTGFTGALSLGYKFDNSFRIEGEVSYRRNRLDRKHLAREFYQEDSHVKTHCKLDSWSYMANFLYDFDQVSCCLPNVVPYVGVGLGYTRNHADLKARYGDHKADVKISGHGICYQGIAGVGYQLTDSTTLAVEYRYFAGKNHARDHGVGLAVRQSF